MGAIAIVGLGHGASPPVPLSIERRLREADHVVVSSVSGSGAEFVRSLGIEPLTYEDLRVPQEASAEEIAKALGDASEEGEVVLVAVGYPFLQEGVVSGLLSRSGGRLELLPLSGTLEVLLMAFDVDLTADLDIVDAHSLITARLERGSHLIITGVRSGSLARRVSERLAEIYPGDHRAVVARPLGRETFELLLSSVSGLSASEAARPGCAVYVAPSSIAPPTGFAELVRIVEVLRGPGGCPWDIEQTHMSLRQNLIEEAYEAVAAIEYGDDEALAEELGDVLLQVVLHARIGAEEGGFDVSDVISHIVGKLRHRHPHIFGSAKAGSADEVVRRWDRLKAEEKEGRHGVLEGVPHALPSLMYAQKVSRRAAAVGFDWETVEHVWEKVHEEMAELRAAEGGPEAEEELGDLLFTLVNVARKSGVDAESALRSATEKFRRRFERMEAEAAERGTSLDEMGTGEMEEYWGRVKEAERPGQPGEGEVT